MAKATPHFNEMMAARGGMGQTSAPPAPRAAAPKPPAKGGGKKLPAPPMAPDSDWDGK